MIGFVYVWGNWEGFVILLYLGMIGVKFKSGDG